MLRAQGPKGAPPPSLIEVHYARATDIAFSEPYVLTAPTEQDADLFRRVLAALYEVGRRHGVHQEWGNEIHATMLDAGLTSVRTRWHSEAWTGGEGGSRLLARPRRNSPRPRVDRKTQVAGDSVGPSNRAV